MARCGADKRNRRKEAARKELQQGSPGSGGGEYDMIIILGERKGDYKGE